MERFDNISKEEIFQTFAYGMHMDASMAGYLCIIPFLFFSISWLFPKIPLQGKLILNYTFILIFLTVVITCIDFNIYTEWGTKINARAIDFFIQSPSEALASAASSPLYSTLFIAFITSMFGFYLSNKIAFKEEPDVHHSKFIIKLPLVLLIFGLTFLAIRGGWSIAPMNPSKVYFSEKPILNHSALNTNWLLLSNYLKKADTKNPYTYFTTEEKDQILDELYVDTTSPTPQIINQTQPNIVFIILESFTADVVEELGGEKGITPGFSKLIKEGFLFTDIYSSGDRTDKGIIATLSAFPSQATRSIIKENDKQEKLPSLIKSFKEANYRTSFFYGGNSEFSNFKSYLLSHKTETLVDASLFNDEDLTSKWGAYDEVTFDKHLKFLNAESQPFFSILLSLSNHEPFQLPAAGKFGDKTLEDKFRSTSYYTANTLLNYIEEAKTQAWYNNTLFVIVADHGHRLPKNTSETYEAGKYHIPLLLLGGALKSEYKGKTFNKTGSQTDIASTLLNQTQMADSAYHYSKNLLNPNVTGFAFYTWDNGFGLKQDQVVVSFDPISNQIIYTQPSDLSVKKKDENIKNAKALMQAVYQDYLKY